MWSPVKSNPDAAKFGEMGQLWYLLGARQADDLVPMKKRGSDG
jgi:hypothetical protein